MSILPDASVASTGWMNPGSDKTVSYSQENGKTYYGQISGQTKSARGTVQIKIN